eukprot:332699_1
MTTLKQDTMKSELIDDNILYIGSGYNKKYISQLYHFLRKKKLHIVNVDFGCNFTIYEDNCLNYYFNNYSESSHTFQYDSTDEFNCLQYFSQIGSPIIQKLCCNSAGGCAFWITDNYGQVYGNGSNDTMQLQWPPKHSWRFASQKKLEPKPILKNFNCISDVQSSRYYSIALTLPALSIEMVTIWIKYIYMEFVPNDIVLLIFSFYGIHKYGMFSIGRGGDGGNGHGNRTIPKWQEIETLKDVCIVKIALGMGHSLFLQANGNVWSCGRNDEGQLGLGLKHFQYTADMRPKEIRYFKENGIIITDIQCGWYHNLAIDSNGNVYSWGYNKFGQCADNSTVDVITPKLIKYLKDYKVCFIKCGQYHSYVKTVDEKYFLFGRNNDNQCITNDCRDIVTVPCCIKTSINEKIMSIKLGLDETLIF